MSARRQRHTIVRGLGDGGIALTLVTSGAFFGIANCAAWPMADEVALWVCSHWDSAALLSKML